MCTSRRYVLSLCCGLLVTACSGGATPGALVTDPPASNSSEPGTPASETPADTPTTHTPNLPPPTTESPAPAPTPDRVPDPIPVPVVAPFTSAVTIAGQPGGCGYAGGTGAVARLTAPRHIAADGDALYIADYNGQIFRITVDPDTGAHTSQRIAALQYLYRPIPEYSELKASTIIDLQPVGNALYVLTSDEIWPQDHPHAGLSAQLWKLPLSPDTLLTEYPAAPLQQFQSARALVVVDGVIHVVGWNNQSGLALYAIQESGGTATSAKILDLPDINPYGAAYSAVAKTLYLPSQPGGSGQTGKGRVWAVDMTGPEHTLAPLPNLVLNYPQRVSVSPSGTELLILDSYASKTLTRYNLVAQTAATILAGPTAADGTMGDGGTARHGKAYSVLAIGDGRFYLGNDCALRLGDTTQIRTVAGHVAGTQANAGFVDGTGPAARFSSLEQMVASPDGTMVYIVDRNRNDALMRPVLRRIAIRETPDGPPTATVLPDAIPLTHPAVGTVNVAELAIIPDPDHPRLFVVSSTGNARTLFYVDTEARSLHRINLVGANGLPIKFTNIAFDRYGRLLQTGTATGGTNPSAFPDLVVTGLRTAPLAAAPEYFPTDDAVRIVEFNADPDSHLVRGYQHAVTYNTFADTFLVSSSGIQGLGSLNHEFRLTETDDAARPFTTQWLRGWRCEDSPGWSPLLTSAAFTADGLYSPARQYSFNDWQPVINRCRPADDASAVVTMSGSSEIGVKDGTGPLGGWNKPTDMVFDSAHQRFYLIDQAERVLRILQ